MNIKNIVRYLSWPLAIGLIISLLLLLLFPNLRQQTPTTTPPQQTAPFTYAPAVDRAAPAVVNIYTDKIKKQDTYLYNPYYGKYLASPNVHQRTLGSGVIVDKAGVILTNNHVINGADQIQVLLKDGRAANAEIIGVDTENDLAVLKINLPNLYVIPIGQSSKLRVGDVTLAIGNPYGVGQSVSQGIVSAVGRYNLGINNAENYIQTDAAINPGNSGGALIDAQGNLIGINTAMLDENGSSSFGISFAVPVDSAINSLRQILQYGHINHIWLGFTVNQTGEANNFHLVVFEIENKSPVEQAGMQVGDEILKINGVEVADILVAKRLIANIQIGSEIKIIVKRETKEIELRLKAQNLPQ